MHIRLLFDAFTNIYCFFHCHLFLPFLYFIAAIPINNFCIPDYLLLLSRLFVAPFPNIYCCIPDYSLLDYPFFIAALPILIASGPFPIINWNISQIYISALPILVYSCCCFLVAVFLASEARAIYCCIRLRARRKKASKQRTSRPNELLLVVIPVSLY